MTTFQPAEILENFKNFIHSSCTDCTGTNAIYNSLHKGIIKMYFQARNVEIDYDNKIIQAEIPVSDKEYTSVSFECLDLERFLTSCLKNDKRSLTFYQSALNYYSFSKVA